MLAVSSSARSTSTPIASAAATGYTVGAATGDEHAKKVDLALECLGELGAIDPARCVSTRRTFIAAFNQTPAGGELSTAEARPADGSTAFVVHLSDEELSARLIEDFLMKPLRGATEGPTVQSAAYAIYRLLRHVCGCTAGTPEHLPAWQEKQLNRRSDAWSRLSEAQRRAVEMWASLDGVTRHAVLPYLSTNPNMNNTAYPDDPSPLYRPGVRYASWLCRWAPQLQARVEKLRDGGAASTEQKRRAELLLDCGDHLGENIVEITEAGGGRALPQSHLHGGRPMLEGGLAHRLDCGRNRVGRADDHRGERPHLRLETVGAAGLQRHRDVVAGRAFDEWLDQELSPDVGGRAGSHGFDSLLTSPRYGNPLERPPHRYRPAQRSAGGIGRDRRDRGHRGVRSPRPDR